MINADKTCRAWLFAAGLVLGFASLGDGEVHGGAGAPFRSLLHVLKRLAQLSAQAEQYYRILTSFSESIDEYRRQLSRDRRQSRSLFVERIFPLGSAEGASCEQEDNAEFGLLTPDFTVAGVSDATWRSYDSTTSLPDVLHDSSQWLPIADDELMLRMLWSNVTTLIDSNPQADPSQPV